MNVQVQELRAHPQNYNRHPAAQVEKIKASLARFGQRKPITTWRGLVLTGHGVFEAARALGWAEIWAEPCPEEWSESEALAWLAADNELARGADPDEDALAAIVVGLGEVDKELAALAAGTDERLRELLATLEAPAGEDPGAQVDKAAELQAKWGTATGQLWQLGEHRLICGDCTDKKAVAQLMSGEQAWLGVTSPPYAVGKGYEIGVSFSQHLVLLRGMADRALEAIEPGGFFFVNFGEIAPQSVTRKLTGSKRQCVYPISKDYWQIFHVERGFDLYAQRIWYKPFNRLQKPFWTYRTSIPHHQEWEHIWLWRCPGGDDDAENLQRYALEEDTGGEWEYIWTMRLPGGEDDQRFLWAISSRAVWDTRRETTDDKPLTRHEAAFPVCLPERALLAHSAIGAIVYEPFLGSGTTLIACQKLGRRCRAAEIEPGYVAVALERWHVMTGRMPVLVGGGV